jgi:hypothetical protein
MPSLPTEVNKTIPSCIYIIVGLSMVPKEIMSSSGNSEIELRLSYMLITISSVQLLHSLTVVKREAKISIVLLIMPLRL